MAITLLGQKREGQASVRKNGKRLVYEETYTYIVQTDDVNTTRYQVLSSNAVPKVNVTIGGGGFTICNGVDANRRDENPLVWDVTATFSSDIEEDNSGANENQSGDPTLWIPIAELGFETFTEVSFTDASGNPFDNSANYVFPNGIPLTRTLVKYEFEQFEPSTTDVDTIADRNETVNSASFQGRDAKTLRLQVKKATLGYYYGYRVWRVSYAMTYKPDTWQFKIADVGPWYLDGSDRKDFVSADGSRIIGNLDGSGASATTASILNFDKYEAISFDFIRVNNG